MLDGLIEQPGHQARLAHQGVHLRIARPIRQQRGAQRMGLGHIALGQGLVRLAEQLFDALRAEAHGPS
ncbi:MAG: hypothetical protein KatS3mg103_0693 [Phycisphaerales bacterium]|nr:MAG: hypothetical protein KatS3mg103_0693 [Phycisphaerales bacterium]